MASLISLADLLVFAPDLELARHFYGDILGLQLQSSEERLLTFTGDGFVLNIFPCESSTSSLEHSRRAGCTVSFNVASLETTMAELSAKGVRFLHESPNHGPFGRYVAFEDPFGTVFEFLQRYDA